jgi:hypothetical protein
LAPVCPATKPFRCVSQMCNHAPDRSYELPHFPFYLYRVLTRLTRLCRALNCSANAAAVVSCWDGSCATHQHRCPPIPACPPGYNRSVLCLCFLSLLMFVLARDVVC